MPLFDSLTVGTEKNAVIFDIGLAYTKCGFASEASPRAIVATSIVDKRLEEDEKHSRNVWVNEDAEVLNKKLVEFFHKLYFRYLHVNPKNRCVLIIESILSTTEFRERIAGVLFKHFEVPSILFAPAHLMALFTLGLQTGLVLDCGYQESLVLPIFEGFPILKAWQAAPLGARSIHKALKNQLMEVAQCKSGDEIIEMEAVKDALNEDLLEDLKVRACFISPIDRARARLEAELDPEKEAPKYPENFLYPLCNGKALSIPAAVRETGTECLFQMDADETNIASLLLDALLACPVDIRKPLAENIVLIGGTCQLPGFKARLKAELIQLLSLKKYEGLTAFGEHFKFHKTLGQPNFVAWLGGAIFGALEVLPLRSLSREAYMDRGDRLTDWSSLADRLGRGFHLEESLDSEKVNVGR